MERFEREELSELMDSLPVGIFILAADGSAIYANQLAVSLLGRGVASEDRLDNLGTRFPTFIAGTSQLYPTDSMPIARAMRGERATVDDMEIERDGERIALEVTATPIFGADGKVKFAVAAFQNITARRDAQRALAKLNAMLESEVDRRTRDLGETVVALEREIEARETTNKELEEARHAAERASRSKSVFLKNVSHDLRTPLGHIIGFTDLLLGTLTNERELRLASSANKGGRELLDKIDSLIELARADATEAAFHHAEFDLDRTIPALQDSSRVRLLITGDLRRCAGPELAIRHVLGRLIDQLPDDENVTVTLAIDAHAETLKASIPSDSLASRLVTVESLFDAYDQGSSYSHPTVDLRLAAIRAFALAAGGGLHAIDGTVIATFPVRRAAVQ